MTSLAETTFDSRNPATDELVGTFPVHGPAEVADAVRRARGAAEWWAGLGFAGRAERLRIWRARLAGRSAELAQLVHREGGKPVPDAMIEIATAIEHVHWAPANAERVLGRRTVRPGLLVGNQAATLEYQPYGVVAVLGPWN